MSDDLMNRFFDAVRQGHGAGMTTVEGVGLLCEVAARIRELEARVRELDAGVGMITPLPPGCAPKGIPVLVAGGIAMKKTGGQWFTGMEEPAFKRPIEWEVKWWSPIPKQNEPPAPPRKMPTPDKAREIMAQAGIAVKGMAETTEEKDQ